MTMSIADSTSCRLAAVPPGGPISGHVVALPPGPGTPEGPPGASGPGAGLMEIPTSDGVIRTAVRMISLAQVAPGTVVVGEDLAAEWDVDLSRMEWALSSADPVRVRRLTLELPTERDPVAAAAEIPAAGLVGELLWVPADGQDMWLSVSGLPHRVRDIDAGGRTAVVARIGPDTAVEVYASAVRAGVDIVILADCSSSMDLDDLPGNAEAWSRGGREPWIRRMDALKQSLRDLLDMRLQISGRISRLALVEFNHQTRQRFPREGGMAELDADSPAHQVEEFRHGVALLRPSGSTNIGNALHEAADLLYQHGHTGNEKLIVLVSDGANWASTGEQGTGEVVSAVEEPVSLMAHLHQDVGIRLHAIGIGTKELFYRRMPCDPTPAAVPNHALLEELVKVGGGDPTTIGGLDVLETYFSGLGAGIIHRVRGRLTEPRGAGPLPEDTRAALLRLASPASGTEDGRQAELVYQIVELAGLCSNEAVRSLDGPIWDMADVTALCQRDMGDTVGTDGELARLLAKVARTLRPNARADRAAAATGPLRRVMDRIEALSRHDDSVPARFTQEFGVRADTPIKVQMEVMRLVRETLAGLHTALRQLPALGGAPGGPDEPGADTPSGFVYRD